MPSRILSLSYRPRTFDDLVGQESTTKTIRKQIKSKRMPAAWMFVGSSGAGKTTVARILALSLQCSHQKEFGHPCKDCRENISNFDIIEINSAEASGVDETEQVISGAFYHPKPPSKFRVYIFDEIHKLSPASQAVLLKYFEDSPRSTVWIVCTTEPSKILKTLRRRCLTYTMPELDNAGVESLVRKAMKFAGVERRATPLVDALLEAGVRSPGFVVMALEKYLTGEKPERAVQIGTDSTLDTLKICRSVLKGDWETVREVVKAATPDDARMIRASVGGYLKSVLLGTSSGDRAKVVADAIRSLSDLGFLEDGLQISGTVSTLYRLCSHFSKSNF